MINLESVDSSEESKSDDKSSKKSGYTDTDYRLIPVHEIPKVISELQKKAKESKKNPVREENKIDKFISPFNQVQVPRTPITVSPFLLEAREKHKDLNIDIRFPEYIDELKRIKKKFYIGKREKRNNIQIFCINYWKKNKEYYRVQDMIPDQYFLANPRNPFDKLDMLDYDLQSDDLDQNFEECFSDSMSFESDIEIEQSFIEKDAMKAEREKYIDYFDLGGTGPVKKVMMGNGPFQNAEVIGSEARNILGRRIKPVLNDLIAETKISKTNKQFQKDMKKGMWKFLHGSYHNVNHLASRLLMNYSYEAREAEVLIRLFCERSYRDEKCLRWYIHDCVLSFLKIPQEEIGLHLHNVKTEKKKLTKTEKGQKTRKS